MIISRNIGNFIPIYLISMHTLPKLCLTTLTARFQVFNEFLTHENYPHRNCSFQMTTLLYSNSTKYEINPIIISYCKNCAKIAPHYVITVKSELKMNLGGNGDL